MCEYVVCNLATEEHTRTFTVIISGEFVGERSLSVFFKLDISVVLNMN